MPRAIALMILVPLIAAMPACKRSGAAEQSAGERRTPDRLMPRSPDQRQRADTTGAERVACAKAVPSVPCTP